MHVFVKQRQRRAKVFRSRSAALAVAGLIIPPFSKDSVGTQRSQGDTQTHARRTHTRTCERGRWQSIMGEIGSYSPALPFSLSLSPEPTAHRHTCAEHARTPTDRR